MLGAVVGGFMLVQRALAPVPDTRDENERLSLAKAP